MDIPQRAILDRFDRSDATLSKLIISPVGTPIPDGFDHVETTTRQKVRVAIGERLGNTRYLTHLIIDLSDQEPRHHYRWLCALSLGLEYNRSLKCILFNGVHFQEHVSRSFFVKIARFWRLNRSINELKLKSCSLDYASWITFGYSLRNCTHLRSISIDETIFTEFDFVALSPALRGSLQELKITNGEIDDYEVETIMKMWTIDNTAPAVLDLSNNPITHDACQSLSRLLKVVKSLSLAHNDLTDYGVSCLFGTHAHGYKPISYSFLTSLNLKATNITDKSCDVLHDLFTKETFKLRELILDDNREITNEGFALLLDGLVVNDELRHLSMVNNVQVDANGWSRLLKVLCDTSTMDKTYTSNHCLETCIPPQNCYNHTETGEAIMQMLQINVDAKEERQNRSKNYHIAGVQKVLQSHLVHLYRHTQRCFLLNYNANSDNDDADDNDDDDKMLPLVLEWMSLNKNSRNSFLVFSSFFHICMHKCHLFELACPILKRKREGLESLVTILGDKEEYPELLACKDTYFARRRLFRAC